MPELVFVDTNVLVYKRDASESQKQVQAETWMAYLWSNANWLSASVGLLGPGTPFSNRTLRTFRLTGRARLATEINQSETEITPFLLRNNFH